MRALLVYNGHSGRNSIKKKLDYIVSQLKTKYEIVDTYGSEYVKSITDKLALIEDIYDLICVAGGDGSVNEAINGIAVNNLSARFAVIPFGTCNDTARSFGIKKNIKKCMKVILEGYTVPKSIYSANGDKYFIYALASGYLTNTSYTAPSKLKRKLGALAYYWECVKELTKLKCIKATVEANGNTYENTYALILFIHTRYIAGNPIHDTYGFQNSKLHFVGLINQNMFMNFIRLLFLLLHGTFKSKYVVSEFSNEITIKSEGIDFNTDGEHLGNLNEIRIVKHKQIKAIVSKKVKRKYHKNIKYYNV